MKLREALNLLRQDKKLYQQAFDTLYRLKRSTIETVFEWNEELDTKIKESINDFIMDCLDEIATLPSTKQSYTAIVCIKCINYTYDFLKAPVRITYHEKPEMFLMDDKGMSTVPPATIQISSYIDTELFKNSVDCYGLGVVLGCVLEVFSHNELFYQKSEEDQTHEELSKNCLVIKELKKCYNKKNESKIQKQLDEASQYSTKMTEKEITKIAKGQYNSKENKAIFLA